MLVGPRPVLRLTAGVHQGTHGHGVRMLLTVLRLTCAPNMRMTDTIMSLSGLLRDGRMLDGASEPGGDLGGHAVYHPLAQHDREAGVLEIFEEVIRLTLHSSAAPLVDIKAVELTAAEMDADLEHSHQNVAAKTPDIAGVRVACYSQDGLRVSAPPERVAASRPGPALGAACVRRESCDVQRRFAALSVTGRLAARTHIARRNWLTRVDTAMSLHSDANCESCERASTTLAWLPADALDSTDSIQ